MAINVTELTARLPAEIGDWKKSPKSIIYNHKSLHEYINGGAELYISYNFIDMAAQKYGKEGGEEITVDIFDMENSFNAFGVFAHSRETVDHMIAPDVESEYGAGLLTFWKGNYYVSIMAYPETEEKKNMVLALGRHISGLIEEESLKPSLIKKLPRENLAEDSIRYFRHFAWLNSHYYISDRDILNMGKDTEAVMARYKVDKGIYYVLLAAYVNKAKAEAGLQSFMKNYLTGGAMIKRVADGSWTGCQRKGKLIMVVLKAHDESRVKSLLKEF